MRPKSWVERQKRDRERKLDSRLGNGIEIGNRNREKKGGSRMGSVNERRNRDREREVGSRADSRIVSGNWFREID